MSNIFNQRLISILLLGFASGLPLGLSGATLQAWFTDAGIDIVSIGLLGLVGVPYVYKFIWAPLLDRFIPPFLGRRRGWILLLQLGLLLTIAAMAWVDPKANTLTLASLALVVAFLSSSQDIAIDAYRTDVLLPEERGLGSAWFVTGYRVAMLVSGAFALVLAGTIGWRYTYLFMAGLMIIGVLTAWFGPEPGGQPQPPQSLTQAVVEPFRHFMAKEGAWAFLLLIILYKLGDAFALSLSTPFLLRGLGFSLIDVGSITKIVGLVATLLGAFIGGRAMLRMSQFNALFIFGLFQAVSNLSYMVLAMVGKHYALMVLTVFLEYLCSGMGTAAFMAFLMSLCDRRYSATQYALFSALASIGRVFSGPIAGVMVVHMGWVHFYWWTFIIALPGVLFLWWMRDPINELGLSIGSNPEIAQ